jgi:glycerol-3-phosphate cytidylyltransferase
MKIGVIAGNFDVMHPGYIKMFKECKEHCDRFFVLLHEDPSIERPDKLKPILSLYERFEVLSSISFIDHIIPYDTEAELLEYLTLLKPAVRFLGDDYIDKSFTGDHLDIPIHYINRDHGWSTTKFKKLIADEVQRSSNI